MNKFIIGIDPGLKGAFCIMDKMGAVVKTFVMPVMEEKKGRNTVDLLALREELCIYNESNAKAYLEKVGAMPKQGVSSMFKMGRGFGNIEAMLCGLGIPYELITPNAWTKSMHLGLDKSLPAKKRSKLAYSRRFPHVSALATDRSKVPHEGIMDAVLIAEYARVELFV